MRITANQVTFARLILLPPLSLMLYGGETAKIVAVIIGTVVGCTDFVDGYLARKHGPTVLGGLMDPIADKVFIAVAFLPYVDNGWVAWWPIALLFLREFMVTAMRSSFELRHLTLKTTYLAKVKTWVQMIGIGLLFFELVRVPRLVLLLIFGIGAALALIAGAVALLVYKKRWKAMFVFFPAFTLFFVVYALTTRAQFHVALIAAIVGITWASGIGYLLVGARDLARARDFHLFDTVRLFSAAAFPVVAILALVKTDVLAWAVITAVSIELAHGGLDNLLAHHRAAQPAWSWGARVLGATALLGLAFALPSWAPLLSIAAVAVSAIGTAISFWRNRRFYLDTRLREKKRSTSPIGQAASS